MVVHPELRITWRKDVHIVECPPGSRPAGVAAQIPELHDAGAVASELLRELPPRLIMQRHLAGLQV